MEKADISTLEKPDISILVLQSDLSFGYLSAELKSPVKIPILTAAAASSQSFACGSLTGLRIGNPKGFETAHFLLLENISVEIDIDTIGQAAIVIEDVLVRSADVIAEFRELDFDPVDPSGSIRRSLKTSNLAAIEKNVDAYIADDTNSVGRVEESFVPKLIIRRIRMNDLAVRAVSHRGLELDTDLPRIHIALDEIGLREGGLTPQQITAVVIQRIEAQITRAMTPDLIEIASTTFTAINGTAKKGIDSASKVVGGGAAAVGSTLEGATQKLTSGAKGASEKIKDLFNKE